MKRKRGSSTSGGLQSRAFRVWATSAVQQLNDRAQIIMWFANHILEMMERPDLIRPLEKCPKTFMGSPTMDPEGTVTPRQCSLLMGHYDQHLWIDWERLLEKP